MGAGVKIEINGNPLLAQRNANKRSVLELGIKTATQGKALCPVEYGELRNTIMVKTKETEKGFNDKSGEPAPENHKINLNPNDSINKTEGYVGTNSDHWYPEFGTRYQVAQPFMRPAKEIVMDGGKAAAIAAKYSRAEMELDYWKREAQRISIGEVKI